MNQAQMQKALSLIASARAALDGASTVLKGCVEQGIEGGVKSSARSQLDASDHRSIHRPGKPRRIDADDELRAFIVARLDHMTFDQITAEVARHFPEGRRVRRSAIHAWWQHVFKGSPSG